MFAVHSDEIKYFSGDQLVALLRRLLYAEARKAGVPLRGVEVPLQITVSDGGQDGSISWEGGNASTDYLPGRDIIFQCKAKDSGDAQWKREVWTKPTQPPRIKVKELSDAVKGVLDRGGTYIGITAKALVNPKPADRVKAIREGITAAGGNPDKLAAIEVYEGNKLAAWASAHPAVAVWVKQINARIDLAGFSTLDHWGKRADIATPAFRYSPDRKFSLGPYEADAIDFSQLAERLADELDQPRTSARIWGASGIGKTRALYHALSTSTGLLGGLTAANFIFCDFREVGDDLWKVANQIVKERSGAVLVVDGCPLAESRRLNDIARAEDSELRVITVGADGIDHDDHCVMVRPTQADHSTIRGILKTGLPKAKGDEIDYLAKFCDGFPRIAVLATETYEKRGILKSDPPPVPRTPLIRSMRARKVFDDEDETGVHAGVQARGGGPAGEQWPTADADRGRTRDSTVHAEAMAHDADERLPTAAAGRITGSRARELGRISVRPGGRDRPPAA